MNPLPGINPKYCAYIGLAVLIEQAIGHGTVSLTNIVPAAWAPYITSWCNLLAFVGTSIMTGQAAYSSPAAGPMIDAPPKSVAPSTIAKILIAAFALSLFLPMGAHAQTAKKAQTLNLPIDPLHLNGTAITGNAEVDLKALWAKIVSASATDLSYASAMAAAAATPAAKQRKQCWDAIAAINAEVNGAGLKDATGAALAKPSPSLFSDIESQAEILDNLSPQGALFTSCAAAAEMAKADVLQFVNAIVTGAAGLGAAGIAIP